MLSLQDQLLADGDGSQVVCSCNVELSQQTDNATSESTPKVQTGKKKSTKQFHIYCWVWDESIKKQTKLYHEVVRYPASYNFQSERC